MPEPEIQRLQDWLRAHEDDLLSDYRDMLRIPSLESEALPNAPFGKENRNALDLALSLSAKYGFKTKDLDGFIGYAEFGNGPLVVSLGHLDVVPVGPGWKHEPFGAELDEGYVYARGAVDDKGPTMASFYAIRAIKECFPDLKSRLRQVFGCNEESGFKCVEHYTQVDEAPVLGVAPDSMWPLVSAEKGIANLIINVPLHQGDFALLEVKGGQRPNIVIDHCEARVRVGQTIRKHVDEKLADSWDKNISFNWKGDELNVVATGKAAHGSTPFYGDSAATRLFRFLFQIVPFTEAEYYENLFYSTHTSGAGLGIFGSDDVSKDLTCNLGIVETGPNGLVLTFNVRYPVTWKGSHLRDLCLARLKKMGGGWTLTDFHDSPSLYFPTDHPLVKTIVDVYREETGESKEPGVMGGGTYARAIPNTVSIGTGWDGDGNAHETDERLAVQNLYKMSRIYAHILYKLALLAQSM
jgi:succinyl-diaminopimelate desuccinylase